MKQKMQKVELINLIPTYTTLKVKSPSGKEKERRVRYFGPVNVYDIDGRLDPKRSIEGGYMFIKNEPRTILSYSIEAVINEKTAQKNLLKKKGKSHALDGNVAGNNS